MKKLSDHLKCVNAGRSPAFFLGGSYEHTAFWNFKYGKTAIGEAAAKIIGYEYWDVDEENKKEYHCTMQQFIDEYDRPERDRIRMETVESILERGKNKINTVSPICYRNCFVPFLVRDDVIAIQLQDSREHIFDRLVFTDDNDVLLTDMDDYKNEHREEYMEMIQEDIDYFDQVYSVIENKFQINGRPVKECAGHLAEMILNLQK